MLLHTGADVRVINATEGMEAEIELGEESATKKGKDLPPWEDKIVVDRAPWGEPRAYQMGGGGWSVMSITPNHLPGRRLLQRLGH